MRNHYANGIFHIYNRGSKKEPIFLENDDYDRFLCKLLEYKRQTKDQLIHYCLLPNHFHLLIKARSVDTISKLMLKLCTSHAMYFCRKYNFVGKVFQDNYKTVPITGNVHLMTISRYIHMNPVEYFHNDQALYDYPWSSYQNFASGKGSELISRTAVSAVLELFSSQQDYIDFVEADSLIFQQNLKIDAIRVHQGSVLRGRF